MILYLLKHTWGKFVVKGLEPGVSYRAFLFNPTNGEESPLGTAEPDDNGEWVLQSEHSDAPNYHILPLNQDWLVVLERG